MTTLSGDLLNGFVKRSTMQGLAWEGSFMPYRALVSLSCDGCRQPIPKGGIVWYTPEQPRRCTRCRNAALITAELASLNQGGETA